MARVLITGATGFIGRAICQHILNISQDVSVTALVRKPSALPASIKQTVIQDWSFSGLSQVLSGEHFDVIFNLAGYGVRPGDRNIDLMQQANVILPTTLVKLAHQCGAVIIGAGSNAEYAEPTSTDQLSEDKPLNTQKLYGTSKASGGLMACAAAETLRISYTHLRLFNVYGPGEAAHRLYPSLLKAARTQTRLALSDGEQIRDFIHIEDVCRAFICAANTASSQPKTQIVNICTGSGQSVKTFALSAFDILNANPALLGFGDIDRRPDDIPVLVGDPKFAEQAIGFRAKLTLQAGLQASFSKELEAA